MPETAQAGNAVQGQNNEWYDRAWSVGKNVAMFIGIQFLMRQFMGGGQQKAAAPAPPTTPGAASTSGQYEYSAIPQGVVPLWPSNSTVDINMFISPSVVMPAFSAMPPESLIVNEKGFALDRSKKDHREVHTSFSVPKTVQDNGTLWAHIFVAQAGAELDPASPSYDTAKAYRMLRPLTSYLAKKKVRKTRSLLGAQNETEIEEPQEEPTGPSVASYYHPNFTLSFVPDTGNAAWASLHPAMRQFYTLEATGARDETGKNGWYYPVLYLNTFWQLKSQMTELNSTIPMTTLPINVDVSTLASWQFSVMASMDEGMKETARKAAHGESTPGGGDGSEMELIKETLLDTNPWLLGTTAFVSVLHMIFELLAFKSDVGHWRKKKDNVGVSFRTILSNVVMQSIIFLYLMDNNENTSWMILFGQGMGIAIEAWKVTKTVDVRVREPAAGTYAHKLGLPYTVVLEDKHKLSETEEQTEEYDKIAFKYMGILAVPLLLAYATYSLIYETHKSWYSFIITTLVGSVYAYGFLMMVPSLYINYRLKSVAHMPAKAMMYKFLNTFIDDLFAFTIKMPILHRLATLRDDVIFFVYLYQAWAYKVDYSRVNEFGQGGDEEEEESKKAAKPLTSTEGSKTDADGKLKEDLDQASKASGKEKAGGARKRKG
ncbi:Cleft lip and palate transmembrane protein 1-like [Pseudocercospora fuligena]|uniref:Cleft lip and palate transmembrane protein 1-like n=1 Tax=Pseudocercospora fuligena TaxID=685502 RepID=A0A8H6RVJ5_9PEZI|nr:Cleft lip and palate transmembrane protein 1-like [Pseudocercospora fuligena]